MKHFRAISYSIIVFIAALFFADVIFMTNLYDSIKERYLDDVEQCLRRADMIELVTRLIESGHGHDGIIEVWAGLRPSDIGAAKTPEELREANYSQGYKRMDRQLVSVITKYLHESYDDAADAPDLTSLEEILRRELNFSGFFPETVIVSCMDDCQEDESGLWRLEHRVDGELIYEAFISPLTRNILREMSGIIVSNALIAVALTFAFRYLFLVISRQRTIEEMKDDFTSNMTHELKTPIAIAYAANDALLQFPDPGDEDRTKKYLTAALDQLSELSALVENILAMSMERRRHLAMVRERIMLRPFIEKIVEQQEIKASKLCSFSIGCDDGLAINADRVHLTNVLNNLIDNSIKYSGESVNIVITATRDSISVSDDGIGIPEKSLSEVFDKFYRVPNGNRQNVRGYGIGLFYVKSIVEKHGWRISVSSKPGKGTKFTITYDMP